jgi:hypothetical protein
VDHCYECPKKGQNEGDTKMKNQENNDQKKKEEEKVAEEMFKTTRLWFA